jgi:hypothetical protein
MAKHNGRQTGGVVRPGVRSGPPRANIISPGGVSELGAHVGNHTTEGTIRGAKPQPLQRGTMGAVPLGNAVATNVGKGGVGTGRTVYARGTNAVHGPVASGEPRPQSRDILREFGPDRRKV